MNLKIKETIAKLLNFWSDYGTENTTDTWVPVSTNTWPNLRMQHRVIPTEKTKTLTGTTNNLGAIALGLSSSDMVRAVACTSDVNCFGIPFKYNNTKWFAKIVHWQDMESQNNKSVTLIVYYA